MFIGRKKELADLKAFGQRKTAGLHCKFHRC